MKTIIIDTNALMAIAELKLDIFTALQEACDFPYQLFVLEETMNELEKIQQEQKGKYKAGVKLVLAIIKHKKLGLIKEKGFVDDLLIQHSRQGDLILTQDQELKKKLTKPYLTIRQKKKIIIIQ